MSTVKYPFSSSVDECLHEVGHLIVIFYIQVLNTYTNIYQTHIAESYKESIGFVSLLWFLSTHIHMLDY